MWQLVLLTAGQHVVSTVQSAHVLLTVAATVSAELAAAVGAGARADAVAMERPATAVVAVVGHPGQWDACSCSQIVLAWVAPPAVLAVARAPVLVEVPLLLLAVCYFHLEVS